MSHFFQAKEAVKEAERCDPESIFTQFSVYKIAVQENDVEKGIYMALAMLLMHVKDCNNTCDEGLFFSFCAVLIKLQRQ